MKETVKIKKVDLTRVSARVSSEFKMSSQRENNQASRR